MKIICDTNVWYSLGVNPPSKKFLENNYLVGTFHAIDELSRTDQVITNYPIVQKAIQALITYPKMHLYEPPLIYLKRRDNPKYIYNPATELSGILKLTSLFANGQKITKEIEDDFKAHSNRRKDDLQAAADILNGIAAEIKPTITNKEKHVEENSIPLNRNLISMFVAAFTSNGGLSDSFDWSKLELFENVLKTLFNELETGAIILTQNDWYDLFNMIYVSPDDKYWTYDRKWIKLIKRAGMEKYLFDYKNSQK